MFKNMSFNKLWKVIALGVVEEGYKGSAGRRVPLIVLHLECSNTSLFVDIQRVMLRTY